MSERHLGSALGRVLGLGTAHNGVHHWTVQRGTAIALAVLLPCLLLNVLLLPDLSYPTVQAWIAGGWVATGLCLILVALCWHSQLGVQVIIEDYVHHLGIKTASLLAVRAVHAVLAVAGVLAVLRIALGSAG
jgi:succinate dehydrogenase / fumarate reductase membrane anchor subunit